MQQYQQVSSNIETLRSVKEPQEELNRLIHDLATPLAALELSSQALEQIAKALKDSQHQEFAAADLVEQLQLMPAMFREQLNSIRSLCQSHRPIPALQSIQSAMSSTRAKGDLHRVLLIEDEDVHCEITAKQLPRHFELTLARSAREAFNLLSVESYDVILLDCILPDSRGEALISEILSVKKGDASVFIVSNLPALDLSRETEKKLSGVLSKPFRFDELRQILFPS